MKTVQIYDQTIRIDKRADYWQAVADGSWEPNTFKILNRFIKNDSFLDIGAWIGSVSLYAAFTAKNVYSFEPDPIAVRELKENLSLNPVLKKKIDLVEKAVTADGENLNIYCRNNFGDSASSMLSRSWDKGAQVEVEALLLEDFIKEKDIQDIGLIKVDIEGGEFSVIPAIQNVLKTYQPTLYLSFHFPYLFESILKENYKHRQVRRVVSFLDRRLSMKFVLTRTRKRAVDQLKTLLESLSFYSFIYRENGELISSKELIDYEILNGFTSLVFTNEGW
ncbi:MAG: FkbM family methyltransferase [Roseivirga sp.]|nr:FkbM family methyltransferase [Roseivirga sp.]